MKKHPLIYKYGNEFILLDPYREVRVGVYDDHLQAMRAWDIYFGNARNYTCMDYEGYDTYVTDEFRKNSQPFLTSKAEIRK